MRKVCPIHQKHGTDSFHLTKTRIEKANRYEGLIWNLPGCLFYLSSRRSSHCGSRAGALFQCATSMIVFLLKNITSHLFVLTFLSMFKNEQQTKLQNSSETISMRISIILLRVELVPRHYSVHTLK